MELITLPKDSQQMTAESRRRRLRRPGSWIICTSADHQTSNIGDKQDRSHFFKHNFADNLTITPRITWILLTAAGHRYVMGEILVNISFVVVVFFIAFTEFYKKWFSNGFPIWTATMVLVLFLVLYNMRLVCALFYALWRCTEYVLSACAQSRCYLHLTTPWLILPRPLFLR